MISEQLAATALVLILPELLLDARLLILVLAEVNESLLAFNVAALAVNLEVLWLQAIMAGMAPSSNFRHFPNAVVHFFKAAEMALASLGSLHIFIMLAVSLRAAPVQQVQASELVVAVAPKVLFKHP